MGGALLRLIAYGTYEFTNYATLRDRSMTQVMVETPWGGLLTGAIVFTSYQGFQSLKTNRAVVEIALTVRQLDVVEIHPAAVWAGPLPVRGKGFVTPLRAVSLSARGGSTVSCLHPAIAEETGSFTEGEVLVRLDDSAARANLKQTEVNIASAQTQLGPGRSKLEPIELLFGPGDSNWQALDECSGAKNRRGSLS